MDSIFRIATKQIEYWKNKQKVLLFTGARQVGKTTMLKNYFSDDLTVLWLNADESRVRDRLKDLNVATLNNVIGNYQIVIIDEIQRIENSGLLLKILVDNFKEVQFIATGSSALDISERIFEPLTGRHLLFHIYPFTLKELYSNKSIFEIEEQLDFHLIYGMYPDICMNRLDAKTLLKQLANQYLYKDVLFWKDIRKPELLDKLLKLLAYQVGSEVSINELANNLGVKSETVESYIDILEKSFVIFRLKSYSTNPRKEISKMSKIYFWDNGIRNAIIGDFELVNVRQDKGLLWENFIISERMKVNSLNHPDRQPFFWRNYNQSEVDYVEIENKKLFGFEIKYNSKKQFKVSKAFENMYPDAESEVITPINFNIFLDL